MPDHAPDEIPGGLPRRMAAALVRLGTIGAVMLCAAGTFAYAEGWLPAGRLIVGRPARGPIAPVRMTAAFHGAGAGLADFRGTQGACGPGLFESAGQATALSRADGPVMASGMVSHFPSPARGRWRTGIDDHPMSVGNSAQGLYDRLMATAPDPAVEKPDPARMDLFLARRTEAARTISLIMKDPTSAGPAASTLGGDRITWVDPGRRTIDQASNSPGKPCTDVD